MPGIRCAVFGCNNSFVNAKKNGANIKFFPFPKPIDLVTKSIREEWIKSCNRLSDFNPDFTRVCSIHFCDKDFKRDFQNELLGLPLKIMLKKTAVPTLFLTSPKAHCHSAKSYKKLQEDCTSCVLPSTHFIAVSEGVQSNIYGDSQVPSKDIERLSPKSLNYRRLYHKLCVVNKELSEGNYSSTVNTTPKKTTPIENRRWFQPY